MSKLYQSRFDYTIFPVRLVEMRYLAVYTMVIF